jgi:hypothetical protein
MAETCSVVGPGGVLRIIRDLGPAALTLAEFWSIFYQGEQMPTLTFSALLDPSLRLFGECYCSGMQEAGVRTFVQIFGGSRTLGGPCGEVRLLAQTQAHLLQHEVQCYQLDSHRIPASHSLSENTSIDLQRKRFTSLILRFTAAETMAALRASKKSGASRQEPRNLRQQTKDDNEETNDVDDDAEVMDVDDDSQEEEPEGMQSTSAEELLSKMVAGVRLCLICFCVVGSIWLSIL